MKFSKSYNLKQIAEITGCNFKGEPEMKINGINEIHKVEKGDITFVDIAKYYKKALESNASAVIINSKDTVHEKKGLIFSDDPFNTYNQLVNHFYKIKHPAPSQKYGENTIIYPGVYIADNVIIGKNCIIYPNVVIHENCQIGDNVTIQANSVIGADAFYYKKRSSGKHDKMLSCGSVIIEDNVEIGASNTIDKGVSGITRIGNGTKTDNQVHIGHGVVLGKNCLLAAQCAIGGKTIIEDNVTLWGQVGIDKDVRIGKGAVILAQSGITGKIEAGKIYFGSPAVEVREKRKELAYLKRLSELFNSPTNK